MARSRNPRWSGVYIEHEPFEFVVGGPSATRQEFADECDINNIMIRYEATGVINHFNNGQPQYLDLTAMPDTLSGTLEQLGLATDAFMRLPAHIRREFDNDPVRFVDFASDEANVGQMRDWGLAEPLPPTPPPAPEAPSAPPPILDNQVGK